MILNVIRPTSGGYLAFGFVGYQASCTYAGLTRLSVFTPRGIEERSRYQFKRERSVLSRYLLRVTLTVVEWATAPADPLEVPVMVIVPVIGAGPPLEHPAITSRRTTAVARLSRPRRPLVFGTSRINAKASSMDTMDHVEIGGMRPGSEGISKAPLVRDTVTWTGCAVVPSAAVIGVATEQLVPVGAPVHVNATL